MTLLPRPRMVLVGEQNTRSGDPRFALYPEPVNCAGWRLCYKVLEMTRAEYLRSFVRVNLLDPGRWDRKAATASAMVVEQWHPDATLVLLGRKVADAFGLYGSFLSARWNGQRTPRYLLLPHPSGRCREWNTPRAFSAARELVQTVMKLHGILSWT